MKKLKLYIVESYKELTMKVSWPSWKELQNSALVVMVASFLIAIVVWIIDYSLGINGIKTEVPWKGLVGFLYSIF